MDIIQNSRVLSISYLVVTDAYGHVAAVYVSYVESRAHDARDYGFPVFGAVLDPVFRRDRPERPDHQERGNSLAYVAGWSKGKEMPELKESLSTIREAASELITAIDEKAQELMTVKEQGIPELEGVKERESVCKKLKENKTAERTEKPKTSKKKGREEAR